MNPAPKRKLRDTDSAAAARRLRVVTWTAVAGLLGLIAGGPLWGLGSWVGSAAFALLGSELAGRATNALHNPSGASTPRRSDYSLPESLAVRERYDEAIAAYEALITTTPEDGEPYLRIARLYRDGAKRPEDALRWFRSAVRSERLSAGQELLAVREIVELCRGRLGDPLRAAPELARMAERGDGTPNGAWAREELAALRAEGAPGAEGGGNDRVAT